MVIRILKQFIGLKNGMILYDNKRTINIETNDFSDLYYEVVNS